MRKFIFYFTFAICLTALFAPAMTAHAAKPVKITANAFGPEWVGISSDYVVWADYRHGDSEVFAYDLNGKVTTRVTNYDGRDSEPIVYGDRVAYKTDWYTVTVANLSVPDYWVMHAGGSNDRPQEMDMYGDWIVWCRYQYSGDNYYRLMTTNVTAKAAPTQIWTSGANDNSYVDDIDVYKDKAIAIMSFTSNTSLYYIDVPTGTIEDMVTLPGDSYRAYLAGDDADIAILQMSYGYLAYDFNTKTFSQLDMGIVTLDWVSISVHGNKIVYNDVPEGQSARNVYMYRLDTQERVRLTNSHYNHIYPVIWGSRVAFVSNEEGTRDIYLVELYENPPDLSIKETGVSIDPPSPNIGDPITISTEVENMGLSAGKGRLILKVQKGDGTYIETTRETSTIAPNESAKVTFDPIVLDSGGYKAFEIFMEQAVESGHEEETNVENNRIEIIRYVNDKPVPDMYVSEDDATVLTFEPVRFGGETSTDFDGINLYSWDFGDGSGAVDANVSHQWADDGVYDVKMTVYDIWGSTNTSKTTITVENRPPDVTHNVPNIMARGRDTVLSAAGTEDMDGAIHEIRWTVEGDPADHLGMVVPYRFDMMAGTVNITLTVEDDDGDKTIENITVSLVESTQTNVPPIAVIQMSGSGGAITFSGAGSYDINGEITAYEWTMDGETYTSEEVSHTFLDGTYFVNLKVTDDEGLTASTVVAIEINYTEPPEIVQKLFGNTTIVNHISGNVAPTLTATYTITSEADGAVSFSGLGADVDGSIASYEWDFDGDGKWDYNSSSGGDATYTYPRPGYYIAMARVTDDNGTSAIKVLSIPIRVNELGNNPALEDGSGKTTEGADMTTVTLLLMAMLVVAIVVSMLVARMSSKQMVKKEMQITERTRSAELQRLIEETRTNTARVDDAESILRDLEGR